VIKNNIVTIAIALLFIMVHPFFPHYSQFGYLVASGHITLIPIMISLGS
jgi:hypothetical protein